MKFKSLMIATALLLPFAAQAADLPYKAPAPVPYVSPAYSWTGFWIGGRGGYGANTTNTGTLSDGTINIDLGSTPKGFVGGGDAGVNFQFGQSFVGGLYIEQDFADLRSSTNVGGISLANLTNYLGAAGAKFGYLVTPASWLYVKGGFAWVGAHPNFAAVGTSQAISDTSTGYELGVGLEHFITKNWSIKIEYDHTHAGDRSFSFTNSLGEVIMTSTAHYTIDKGMAGGSFHF